MSRVLRFVLVSVVLAVMLLQAASPIVAAAASSPAGKGVSVEELARLLSKIDRKLLDEKYMRSYFERAAKMFGLESPEEVKTIQLLVQLEPGADAKALQKVLDRYGASVCGSIPALNIVKVCNVPAGDRLTFTRALLELARLGSVEKVWLNDIAKLALFDTRILIGFAQVQESLGINGSGVKVAVLDTGFDDSHPELNGVLAAWIDFINNETEPYDDHGHGTFVSSNIAAQGRVRWMYGEGMWHTILYADQPEFNSPGPANLTYAINVSAYAGSNITVELYQRLCLSEGETATILYRFDTDTGWSIYANYTNTTAGVLECDPTQPPEKVEFNLTVPTNATMLYLSFVYEPTGVDVWSGVYWYVYQGWFLDNITVFNASNPADQIFADDVEGPAPAELVESSQWLRTATRLLGVAPGAKIMAAKVCSTWGCPYDAILNAIVWATLGPDGEPGTGDEADIISMSLGGPATEYDVIAQAVDWAAYNYSRIVVVAAGNEGPGYYTVASPGIAHGAITAGASTKTGTIAFFSSWGPSPVDYTVKPDILAPGRLIIGAYSSDAAGAPPGTYLTAVWDGTSFSTPHVSGIVALIKQAHPDWGLEEVRSALVSTATMPAPSTIPGFSDYPVNVYTAGGGIVNVYRAVTTTFLPVPAMISFHYVLPGVNNTVQAIVTLENMAASPVNATVKAVELYDLGGNSYSSWVVSPVVNETYTVPANGTAQMNLTIAIPNNATGGLYWGRILLDVGGETYQVLFGFNVGQIVKVSGYVVDAYTGQPVANATVAAVSADLATVFNVSTSDSSGYFEVLAPANYTVRLVASANGYYQYISPMLRFTSNATYTIYATPVFGAAPRHLLVVVDSNFGDFYSPYTADPTVYTSLNGTLGALVRLFDNTYQGVAAPLLLSGDFTGVAWLASGVYYPVNDPLDLIALVSFANTTGKGVILEGGDIGWYHGDDELMAYVAHAIYVSDMSPGSYTVEVTALGHVVTYGLPGSFTIDSGQYVAGAYGYPDAVAPANNGYEVAAWLENGYSAIVAYNGFEHGGADTVYIAFPIGSIVDSSVKQQLVLNTMIWALDHEPPTPPVNATLNASIAYVNDTLAAVNLSWTGFSDMSPVISYRVYVNGTLAAETGSSTRATLLLEPGKVYMVTIEAADAKNYSSTLPPTPVYIPPYGTQGGAALYLSGGNYTGTFPGTSIAYNISANGTAVVQAVLLKPSEAASFAAALGRVVVVHVDIKTSTPSNITQLTVAIPYSEEGINEDTIEVYWYNATAGKWMKAENYVVDTANNTVYLTFNATTTPSIYDLYGTPIAVLARPSLVGGSYTLPATIAQLVAALAALAALAAAILAYRRN